jgi:serine/threonine protein kinase
MDHPNLVEVVEVADSHAYVFQFMRLAEHGDLLHRIRVGPIDPSLTIRIIDSLLSAVEYLHSYGICHRDIKLENILLARSTGVKLCDLGLATVTFDGTVKGGCGSFEYSAPEVFTGFTYDGFKADMWSVGVVIYALFARMLPFQDITQDFDFANAAVDYSGIPPAFRPLVGQLLSIDPEARPHATQARSFPGLNSSEIAIKEPFSAIPGEIELGENVEIVSRLSQILRTPFGELMALLASNCPCIERLVFVLAQKKLAVGNPLLKGMWQSLPPHDLANRTIRESFPDCSANVFRHLHALLMRQRCCVSSPIGTDPVIVPMKEVADVRIGYSCIDEGEGNQSILTLVVHEDSDNLAQMIMAQMVGGLTPSA